MAKVIFIIVSAIVACVFADYPLPYPSYVPSKPIYYPPPVPSKPQLVYGAPKPPPIPATVYGVPEVIKRPAPVKPFAPVVFEAPKKPSIVYGVPHTPTVAYIPHIPNVPHRETITYVVPEAPKQPSLSYGVPHHHPTVHHQLHEIPKKFIRTPVVSHYKYEIPQQQPVFQPFKTEVPAFYYPKPASVYGVPHF